MNYCYVIWDSHLLKQQTGGKAAWTDLLIAFHTELWLFPSTRSLSPGFNFSDWPAQSIHWHSSRNCLSQSTGMNKLIKAIPENLRLVSPLTPLDNYLKTWKCNPTHLFLQWWFPHKAFLWSWVVQKILVWDFLIGLSILWNIQQLKKKFLNVWDWVCSYNIQTADLQ